MMLGGPQRVVAAFVHHLGDVARREEDFAEALVRVAAVVGGRAVETDAVEVDLTDIEDVEAFDHRAFPRLLGALAALCQHVLDRAKRLTVLYVAAGVRPRES